MKNKQKYRSLHLYQKGVPQRDKTTMSNKRQTGTHKNKLQFACSLPLATQ